MLSDKKVLLSIQKEKRNPSTITNSWLVVFTNPTIMNKIIPQTHVFDIINLASTCRYLYKFYYGDTRLVTALRYIVKRDLNAEFKRKHPLRHLGNRRNTKPFLYKKSYTPADLERYSVLCASCSRALRVDKYSYENPVNYVLCWNCEMISKQFNKTIFPELMAKCINKFDRSCLPRIARFIKRFSFKYTDSLNHRIAVDIIYERVSQLDLLPRTKPPSFEMMETFSKPIKKREREEDPYAGVVLYVCRERIGFEDMIFLQKNYNIPFKF